MYSVWYGRRHRLPLKNAILWIYLGRNIPKQLGARNKKKRQQKLLGLEKEKVKMGLHMDRKKKKKKEAYNTCCFQAVTHPSTEQARHCLTSVIRRELVYSVWYGRRHRLPLKNAILWIYLGRNIPKQLGARNKKKRQQKLLGLEKEKVKMGLHMDRKKKKKKEAYNTCCSQAVTHPSTEQARHCLTSVIRRELVYSVWYGRRHRLPLKNSILWIYLGRNILKQLGVRKKKKRQQKVLGLEKEKVKMGLHMDRKKKKKKEAYNTCCSQAVTHPSTEQARHCLTSVIRRELV